MALISFLCLDPGLRDADKNTKVVLQKNIAMTYDYETNEKPIQDFLA